MQKSRRIKQRNSQRQPFYLSIILKALYFTRGSISSNLVERSTLSNLKLKDEVKKSSQLQNKRCILNVSIEQNDEAIKIQNAKYLGSFKQQNVTQGIFEYPIQLTSFDLQSYQPLSTLIPSFLISDPNPVISINVSFQISSKQIINLGTFQIDPNVYILMTIQDKTIKFQDSKALFRINTNDNSKVYINAQVQFQVHTAKTRLQIQQSITKSKKGINITDFKQQVRKILQQRQQNIEKLSPKSWISSFIQQQNTQTQKYFNLQVCSPQQLLNLSFQQYKKTLRSQDPIKVSQQFHKYLKTQIQSQLHYSNPQKQMLLKQFEYEKKIQEQKLDQKSNSIMKQVKLGKNNKKQQKQQLLLKSASLNYKQNRKNNKFQNIKIIIFLIVSMFILYFVMSPSKKLEQKIKPTKYREHSIDDNYYSHF